MRWAPKLPALGGPYSRYALAISFAISALIVEHLATVFLGPAMFFMFYPAVLFTAWFAGLGPALLNIVLDLVCVFWLFGVRTGQGIEFFNLAIIVRFTLFALINTLSVWMIWKGKRYSSALEKSEERLKIFSALVENSSDFIGIADPNGAPIYVNPSGRRMVGLDPDDPVQETKIPEYYAPDQRAFASDVILKEMLEHGRWKGETFFRHWKTQEAIPVSDEHFMIRDPRTNKVLGMGTVTRDITEITRARAEMQEANRKLTLANGDISRLNRELRQSQEFLDRIIELMPSIVFLKEARDLRYIICNRAGGEFLGLAPKSVIGKTDLDLFPKDEAKSLIQAGRNALATSVLDTPELAVHTTLGDKRTLYIRQVPIRDADGKPTHLLVLAQDVTERKRFEIASQQLAAIIEFSDDAILGYTLDGTITSWNHGAERLYGYTSHEAIGKNLGMMVPPDRDNEIPRILKQLRQGGTVKPYETTRLCKGNVLKEVSLTVSPIKDLNGKVVFASSIARDITARKRAQELQQAVLAMASHELSNPLTTVTVVLKMLAADEEAQFSERQRTAIKLGVSAADRMARMITDFLTYEKLRAGELPFSIEVIDLAQVVAEAAQSMKPIAGEAGVTIHLQPEEGIMPVKADRDRLIQVIINLISNAVKFSPKGGAVMIALQELEDKLRVTVSDEGPGVPPEFRKHIFKRFARGAGVKAAGSGLGLSISKAIVERLGGRIGFENREPKGTTFYFELPAARTAPTPAGRHSSSNR